MQYFEQFEGDWDVMMGLFLQMGVSLLLYGIYISLFLLTIHLLFRRRKSPGIKLLIVMSCIMAVLGTTQMAVTIAQTAVVARFVQQIVHSQVLNEHETRSNYSVLEIIRVLIFGMNYPTTSLLYRCYVIWGFRWKVVIVPALLMLSTFVMGIMEVALFSGSVNDMTQIGYGLAAAANLVLTALTGKLVQLVGYYGSSVQHHMLVLTAHSAVVTTRQWELYETIYFIGATIAEQLINIIPTFTLVYVGLNNTDYSQPKEQHICQVPSTHYASSRSAVVRPSQPCEVLDIKPQSTEEKDGECI
ncbi:hypothetical protein B0H13DRAFT_1885676 [Mycena leptocephala]|nr:hypothetical protein B0H13DRAFT_1885676 [Mycena leptocephala]